MGCVFSHRKRVTERRATSMNVYISPTFSGVDNGEGGIRRVCEAQIKYLPQFGVNVVDSEAQADLVAIHAGSDVKTLKPTVAHCHGLYWNDYQWSRWAYRLNSEVINVMNKADAVTAPSEWVANALRRGMLINPTVIGHGLDLNEWFPTTAQGFVLWNKTRIDTVCTPEPLNRLVTAMPETKFVTTFGDTAPNVTVTGRLPFAEAQLLLEQASVYLCTTRETFGIGTIEALACGVPILGWAWGAQTEFIEHGKTGYLVKPGDIAGLVEGYKFINDNWQTMHQACLAEAQQFAWPKLINKYANLYKLTLAAAATPVKVSVVIPCYNLGHLVGEAVNSVLAQTGVDYEIILVNDASTDDSLTQLKALCNRPNISLINNQANQYLATSLNIGIAASKGKYVLPLDADNMIAPGTLQTLSAALDLAPEVGIAYGAMEVIEPSGKRFISGWPTQFDFAQQMKHRNQIPSTCMYRKSIWQRVNGYRARCRTAEDADFWCRASSFGGNPRKVTDAVTLIYRNRPDSMSHTIPDWPWHQQYSWWQTPELAPYAIQAQGEAKSISSYNPFLISVVIPCGPGHIKYLPDAIDSLISQTFLKWECIIVNDTDETIDNVPSFVTVLKTPKAASGPAVARNIGIRASSAATFVLLDADDTLQPTALADLYSEYLINDGYVYCDWIVAETGEVKQSNDYDCEAVLHQMLHPITGLYSKRSFDLVKGFDETITAWEDWNYLIALAAQGVCGHRVAKPLLRYRMQTGTLREKFYAERETLKVQIADKWQQFITGGVKLPCAGCGSRRRSAPNPNSSARIAASGASSPVPQTDVVLIEFTKPETGTLVYVGAVTKTRYKFGSDPEHKFKYVYKSDAPALLAYKDFKLAEVPIAN